MKRCGWPRWGCQSLPSGRATFTNIDYTKRRGAEIDLRWRIADA